MNFWAEISEACTVLKVAVVVGIFGGVVLGVAASFLLHPYLAVMVGLATAGLVGT